MEENIINATIKLLDKGIVKFTVDDIKNELKISKKTVYKYFNSKEALAKAVFEKIVSDAKKGQQKILASGCNDTDKMVGCLLEYMEIFRLDSGEIFNLYCQDEELQRDIMADCEQNWQKMLELYHSFVMRKAVREMSDRVFKTVVEGTIKNIYFSADRNEIGHDCLEMILCQQ